MGDVSVNTSLVEKYQDVFPPVKVNICLISFFLKIFLKDALEIHGISSLQCSQANVTHVCTIIFYYNDTEYTTNIMNIFVYYTSGYVLNMVMLSYTHMTNDDQ